MTKEELKLEAENKLDEWSDPDMGCAEGYCYAEVADFMFRFAESREEHIEELKKANETLATMNNDMWVELEKKRAESQGITNKLHQLIKAKDLIRNIIRVTWKEGWNYSLDWKVKAEQFLEEVEND